MIGQPVELFTYRLALAMRIWNVEQWKGEIGLPQLRKWWAYWFCEPFGMEWQRSAKLAVVTAEAAGCRVDLESVERFLPTWRRPELSEEEEERRLIAHLKRNPILRAQMEANGV